MLSNKAYKFRIYPNKEQRVMFAKTFGCVRFVYNYYRYKNKSLYGKTNKFLSYSHCAKDMAALKMEHPFLKEVDSISLQQSLRHLDKAYKNFSKNSGFGYPNVKEKHSNHHSYSTVNVNNNISLSRKHIKLPKVGLVRIKRHREIPDNYALKSATISKTPSGKYYVSVLFEYENQVREITPQTYIGLDFSVPKLFVSSEPETQTDEVFLQNYRKSLDKLAKEQRVLSHRRKGSKRYEKQRIKVAKCHEYVANKRNDYLHKVSTEIANRYDAVCVEDIKMREVTDNLNKLQRGMGKYVVDNGFYGFTTMLKYKLADRGKYLITVGKEYPSSQLCCECGHINSGLTLSDRTWTCPNCGKTHDRDKNAAINIKYEGTRIALA